jgi:chemotaxis protein MotB
MASHRGRKKKHDDHGEHPDERWLVTYADLMTLLVALFMVLFSMSAVNKGKFAELAKSLKESFSGPLQDGGKSVLNVGARNPVYDQTKSELTQESPVQQVAQRRRARSQVTQRFDRLGTRQDQSLQEAQRRIDLKVRQLGLGRHVQTRIEDRGLVIRLVADQQLFPVGSAQVRAAAVPLLGVVAAAVNRVQGNPVRVEGYADARRYAGDPHGNDRLAGERAMNIYFTLLDHGFDDHRHQDSGYTGFGSKRFLVPGDPYAARNRRVEVVVQRIDYGARAARVLNGPIGTAVGAGTGAGPAALDVTPAAGG